MRYRFLFLITSVALLGSSAAYMTVKAAGRNELATAGARNARDEARRIENCLQTTSSLSFSTLRPDQSIVVDLTSHGCFHSSHYGLRFSGGTPMQVQVTDHNSTQGVKSLTLEPGDKSKLDRLLVYYCMANGSDGGCTTVQRISFTLLEGTTERTTLQFVDSTCTIETAKVEALYEMAKKNPLYKFAVVTLSMWEIIERAKVGN